MYQNTSLSHQKTSASGLPILEWNYFLLDCQKFQERLQNSSVATHNFLDAVISSSTLLVEQKSFFSYQGCHLDDQGDFLKWHLYPGNPHINQGATFWGWGYSSNRAALGVLPYIHPTQSLRGHPSIKTKLSTEGRIPHKSFPLFIMKQKKQKVVPKCLSYNTLCIHSLW